MIIDSPVISGSLANSGSFGQVGDVSITGSLTVTGNINGNITGSAVSASQAVSASYSLSSSYALSSSYGLSGSYAATASSADSFLVRGTLTAQTIVVQTITSSVDFVTGSTHFGSIISNTHEFTGSVGISGSLAVNNSAVISTAQTSSMSVLSASYAATASYWSGSIASASYAANATTSSYALTASYAANVPVTAAYADNANSASYAANATSASYALTASYWSGSIQSASYALTASYALNAGAGAGFPYSGSAVITGSLLITNLTSSGTSYLVADANGNITAQSASAALKTTQPFTATAGQTVFAVSGGYVTGYVDVFINGSKLSNAEFVDTSGTNIVLATGSFVNDVVEVVKYMPAAGVSTNVLRQLTSFTATAAQTVFTVDYTPGLLDVYYNGARLSSVEYTAANGTSITLATASAAGDVLDVMVYSYQVGAMSGIGGNGAAGQIAYYNTTNSITGSPNFSIVGSTINVTGSFIVSSSSTFTNIGPAIFSGSVTAVGGFSGSFSGSMSGTATSASAAISSSYATSASVAISSSYALSSSYSVSASAAVSSSYATSASAAVSSSYATSASVAVSAANSTLFENTASVRFATTGSNNFTAPQHVTDLTVPTGFANTSGSIYTDGGLLVNKDAYFSSSMFIKGNLTIYGTQSIAYITSSQLNIATNLITVNTATPSVRFGGLAVYDSGSTGTGMTGSLLWDSQNNSWIYDNPSGSDNYDSSMVIMGPRNASALGSEQGLNCNYLIQGHGHHHTTSSMIYHDGTNTCIPNALLASGCIGIGTITPYANLHVLGTIKVATGNAQGIIGLGEGNGATVNVGLWRGAANAPTTDGNYLNIGGYDGVVLATGNAAIGSQTERMRINSSGNVLINCNRSEYGQLQVSTLPTTAGAYASALGLGFLANACEGASTGISFYTKISLGAGIWENARISTFTDGISSSAYGALAFSTMNATNLSERMRIGNNGYIGVNTTNALSRFDISLQSGESLTIGNCSNTITCGDLIGALTFVSRDASTNSTGGIAGIRSYATQTYNTGGVEGDLRFYTSIINTQPNGTILSGNEVLRLSQDGIACFACRVCVPSLSVSNTNAVLTIQGTATSGEAQLDLSGKNSSGTSRGAVFKYDNSDIIRIGTSSPIGMRFETCDVTRLTITSAGNVGIGTCCPTHQLHVVNSVKFDTGLYFNNGAANGAFVWQIANESLRFGTCDTERMRITNGGNVLIGTQSASNSTLQIVCVPSSYYGMIETVGCSAGSVKHFRVHKPGYVEYGVGVLDTNAFHISTASTFPTSNGFTMLSGGNIGFGETAPGTDKMVILGGTANSNIFLRLKTDGSHGIKPQIHFDSGLVGTNRSSKAIIMGGYNSPTGGSGGVMQFYTNDTSENSQQRMCIDPAGQVTIMGALAKGSGSFRICHPLSSKVKTHALVHSFIEGPNADLIYSGHTKLIGGVSCINIDCISRMTEGTFEALNRCVRIFTTNESSWNAVRGKVCGNIVIIESQDNTSEDEISWMVIGERQDEHMFETEWTDSEGRVITEPEVVIVNDDDITE